MRRSASCGGQDSASRITRLALDAALAGRNEAFFRAAARLAGFGELRKGRRGDAVGLALAVFRLLKGIGRLAAGSFRIGEAGQKLAALFLDLVGGLDQLFHLLTRLAFALAQGGDVAFGAGRAALPRLALGRDGHEAAAAVGHLAGKAVMGGAGFGQRRAVGCDIHGVAAKAQVEIGKIGRVLQGGAGILQRLRGLLHLRLDLGAGLGKHGAAADEVAGGALGSFQRLAGLGQRAGGVSLRLARRLLALRLGADRLAGAGEISFGLGKHGAGVFRLGFEFGKAVLLFQAKGGGARCVRAGDMAVPAEDGAFAGDEPLAGLQFRQQGQRFLDAAGNTDLCETAVQDLWRPDMGDQRGHIVRQGGIARSVAGLPPVHGRIAVSGRIEIVTECSAQRGLVAAIDIDLFHDRRKGTASGTGFQHTADGAGFRLDAGKAGTRGIDRATQGGFVEAGLFQRLFDRDEHLASRFQRFFGRLHGGAALLRVGERVYAGIHLLKLARLRIELLAEPQMAFGKVADRLFELVAHRLRLRALGGDGGKGRFAFGEFDRSLLHRLAGSLGTLVGLGEDFADLLLLRHQPFQHGRVVGHHAFLAGNVLRKLGKAAGEFVAAAEQPGGIFLKLRAGDLEALENGRELGFVLAQFGQLQAGDGLVLGGLHLRIGALGDERGCLIELAFRLAFRVLGLRPADMQQHRLMAADIG